MKKMIWIFALVSLVTGACYHRCAPKKDHDHSTMRVEKRRPQLAAHRRATHESQPGATLMLDLSNGGLYAVAPGQTLGEAMASQAPMSSVRGRYRGVAAAAQEEEGNCYAKGANKDKLPPEAQEECRCWEVTECGGNSDSPQGEFRCKRHCKKDNCSCCSI